MDRRKMALECLEVERIGYSVLDFLREQGAISPWGTWWRLQVEELGRARYQIRDGKENKMAKKNVLTPQVRAEAESMIEDGEDPDGCAMIYGEDYDRLTGDFEELLIACGLIEKER